MALQGKTALITGGASGLGRHLAETLHSRGVTLIIADINHTTGVAFVQALNETREGSAYFHKVDVTKWEDQVDLFKATLEDVKRIDYVFANAGVLESTFIGHTSAEKVEWVEPNMMTINVNVLGALYTCQLATQVFRTQTIVDGFRGKMVVTASVASFSAITYMPLYSASKHALVGFIRSFAPQLASEGITVNAVAPNVTRSSLAPSEVFDAVHALGRLTSNEKVTSVFLSYLGDNKDTGLIKEVSMDDIFVRPAPVPVNQQVTDNAIFLAEGNKAAYAAPAPAEA